MLTAQRALVRMPDVVGLPLRKARLLVQNAGLVVDAITFQESYETRDNVLAQKPMRGQMVYAGDKVTLTVSRESYVKWLPSIYQRADINGRNFYRDFLWIGQHLFGSIEEILDIIHQHFDPYEAPEKFLPWLASWSAMVLEEDWPLPKKRRLIRKAIELYRIRGTVKGLKLFISLFTGHVEMPVSYKDVSPESVIRIHEIIQMEKPANTQYYLRFASEGGGSDLSEFMAIGGGVIGGIGLGAADSDVITSEADLKKAEVEASRADIRLPTGDTRKTQMLEIDAQFQPMPRSKPPLPKAPRADLAPVEGKEGPRSSKAGGFEGAAREMAPISNTQAMEVIKTETMAPVKTQTQIKQPPAKDEKKPATAADEKKPDDKKTKVGRDEAKADPKPDPKKDPEKK
jgi:phage tail-like protein